jgi:hypothetical protein
MGEGAPVTATAIAVVRFQRYEKIGEIVVAPEITHDADHMLDLAPPPPRR